MIPVFQGVNNELHYPRREQRRQTIECMRGCGGFMKYGPSVLTGTRAAPWIQAPWRLLQPPAQAIPAAH